MLLGTGKVGCVGGHHDQGEEPPHDGHSPRGKSPESSRRLV